MREHMAVSCYDKLRTNQYCMVMMLTTVMVVDGIPLLQICIWSLLSVLVFIVVVHFSFEFWLNVGSGDPHLRHQRMNFDKSSTKCRAFQG